MMLPKRRADIDRDTPVSGRPIDACVARGDLTTTQLFTQSDALSQSIRNTVATTRSYDGGL